MGRVFAILTNDNAWVLKVNVEVTQNSGGQTVPDESSELEAVLVTLIDDAPGHLQTVHVREEEKVEKLGENLFVVINLDGKQADIQSKIRV